MEFMEKYRKPVKNVRNIDVECGYRSDASAGMPEKKGIQDF